MKTITSSYGKHFASTETSTKDEFEQYLREAALYQYITKVRSIHNRKRKSANGRKQRIRKLNKAFELQQRSITCIMKEIDPTHFRQQSIKKYPLEAFEQKGQS